MRKTISPVLRFCRSKLIAYVLISFAISGSFYMLGRSFDHKLARVQYQQCQRQNAVFTSIGMPRINCSKATVR